MISTGENISDTFIGVVHPILEEIHSHLTWNHIFFLSVVSENISLFYTEMSSNRIEKFFIGLNRSCHFLGRISYERIGNGKFIESSCDIINGRRNIMKLVFSDYLIEYPFYLSNVRTEVVGDEFRYFLRKDKFSCTSFFLKDSQSSLEIRDSDIDDDSPFKTTSESWFQCSEFLWWLISWEDNLLVVFVQCIEDVVKHCLSLIFSSEKLYIIDNKNIDGLVFFFHSIHGSFLYALDIIAQKPICRCIDDFLIFVSFFDGVTNRLEYMGFPESNVSVNEKWIVRASWTTNNCFGSSMNKLIGWSDDEILETVFTINNSAINSFYHFSTRNLFFFLFGSKFFVFYGTIYNTAVRWIIDILIYTEIYSGNERTDFLGSGEDFIKKLMCEIVSHKTRNDSKNNFFRSLFQKRNSFEIREEILFSEGGRKFFDNLPKKRNVYIFLRHKFCWKFFRKIESLMC